jgi:PHD/YefM family antitoxin component YafN of YafNO toxin-antitoxin module
MQTVRSLNLQKNLGDVLQAADVEPVLVLNREQPRTVMMSAEEFIRLKVAAGEPVPTEARKSRPALQQSPPDLIGYDTRDPDYPRKMAEDERDGKHGATIEAEIDTALARWGFKP